MREVVEWLIEALERDRGAILCQVLETKGSTPQKAGAMMAVDGQAAQAGTLGGGCVENEVKTRAMRSAHEGQAALHSFVLDHDYAWADGLICGGKMTILTQSLTRKRALAYFRSLLDSIEAAQGFTEAVVADPAKAGLPIGDRFLLDASGQVTARMSDAPGIGITIPNPLERPKPTVKDGFALLPSWPRIRLVIVGAGHVGQAVAGLAGQADFDVCVVDDRRQYANPERFPTAREIVVGPIAETLRELAITPQTYALIVTRGHGHDQEALEQLAPTEAEYVGLIGSKRKIRLIFESLLEQVMARSALDRVSAPVGLEIGSQTVPEIAISIVAELIARRNLGGRPAVDRPITLDRRAPRVVVE